MKVLVLSPPNSFSMKKGENTMANRQVPLDLATIGTVLSENNDVKILDALALKLDKNEIITEIDKENSDLILISPFDRCRWAYEPTREILKVIKKRRIGLIGGYDPAFIIRLMKEEKNIDFSTYGDPEITLSEVTKKKSVDGIKGTIYRKGGKIVKYSPREFVDVDKLPLSDRDMLQMETYVRFPHENKTKNPVDILASRGCPFQCTYCLVEQLQGKKYRVRSPENVFREIKLMMMKFNTNEFHFMDSVFTMDSEWTMKFCTMIKPLKIEWSCQTRVDLVNEKILKQMKDAGCFSILYGAESLDPKLLKNIKKGITVEQIRNAVRLTKKVGIESRLSLMFGLPGETPDDARKTIAELINMNPDFVQFHNLVVFPGTPIEKGIEKNDWGKYTNKVKLKDYDVIGIPFLPKGYRNREELDNVRKSAYKRFYLRPRYILRLFKKPSELLRYIRAFRIFRGIMRED